MKKVKSAVSYAFEYDLELLLVSIPEGKPLSRLKLDKAYGFDDWHLTDVNFHWGELELHPGAGVRAVTLTVRTRSVAHPTSQDGEALTSLFVLEEPGRIVDGRMLNDGPRLRLVLDRLVTDTYKGTYKHNMQGGAYWNWTRAECSDDVVQTRRWVTPVHAGRGWRDLKLTTSVLPIHYRWSASRRGSSGCGWRRGDTRFDVMSLRYDGDKYLVPPEMGPMLKAPPPGREAESRRSTGSTVSRRPATRGGD